VTFVTALRQQRTDLPLKELELVIAEVSSYDGADSEEQA
jgi:hypothetical protein